MSKQFAQPPTVAKALRLLEEGKVQEVTNTRTFQVRINPDLHIVTLGFGDKTGSAFAHCGCDYEHRQWSQRTGDPKRCEHILAARLYVDRERTPDPFEGLL